MARPVLVHLGEGDETFHEISDRIIGERWTAMCLDCGCGEPNDQHGDERHITLDDVRAAAEASEISLEEAKRNVIEGLSRTPQSSPSAD